MVALTGLMRLMAPTIRMIGEVLLGSLSFTVSQNVLFTATGQSTSRVTPR